MIRYTHELSGFIEFIEFIEFIGFIRFVGWELFNVQGSTFKVLCSPIKFFSNV